MARYVKTVDIGSSSSAYYAPATVTSQGGVIHIAGQPGTTKNGKAPDHYESQIQLALFNLRKVIIASGASVHDILKLTLYIVNYDPDRRLHTRHVQTFLAGHRPAITLVPVSQLAVKSWLFEIDAVVAKPEAKIPIIGGPTTSTKSVDVVIVGAGLAGLTAAHEVLKAGFSCVVLEARDRVGGRTYSQKLTGGETVDLGAAWINDTNQSRIFALAQKIGAELVEQNTTGDCVLQDTEGNVSTFPYGELPNFDEATKQNIAFIRDTTEADCQAVSCASPQSGANAHFDSMSFATYLRSKGATENAIKTATVWTRAMLGHEPEDISALFFLNYCKSGGGLLQMRSDRKGGGQHLRFRQGTQSLALGLARSLPEEVVQLSSAVDSIWQLGPHHAVIKTGGQAYQARKVISAVPPPVLQKVAFNPPLPTEKQILINSFFYGCYQKVLVVFKEPFWVKKGLCGLAQSFNGPIAVIRDTSVPADNKWILTCFMAGAPGRAWAQIPDAEERKRKVLQQVAQIYSEPKAQDELFLDIATWEWNNDNLSGYGCPSSSLPPGALDSVGHTLREPFGNVHFIGTETAEEWKGYMEGAIRSGERGAKEAVDELSRFVAKL
ncbi:putative flavin-containing amine oxidase [Polychaeton citri CBS 116435]|uniref:Amine oxidase n=1 Tax=Polychaeton citri CBS 116435 TaxID=1314669 RepID=A0A9P4Q5T6_9PEZI|nr:putative flavin-containing amine oxidase [Polychaeton citri CBS 116435]